MPMGRFPHLTKAPIESAIIAVKIPFYDEAAVPEKLSQALKEEYNASAVFQNAIKLSVGPPSSSAVVEQSQKPGGYVLHSKNGQREVSLTQHDIALRENYNENYKYQDWKHFLELYNIIWTAYEELHKPESLIRVGLRYINRFNMKPQDITDVLGIKPVIEGTNCLLDGFMARFALRSELYKSSANVAVVIQTADQDLLQVTLDIDAFDTDIKYHDAESLNGTLERLRMLKNHLFFENVPDAEKRFA
jgi:uncharacterized protein (TIGR04255 family)